MVEHATVQVRKDTKDLLAKAKQPGETFDQVIRRTLEQSRMASETAFLKEVNELLDDRDAMKPLR